MYHVNRSALVSHDAARMYALVADISRYPGFLPWCREARLSGDEGDTVVATLQIGYRGVHKAFTTRNRNTDGRAIDIELVDGPFSHLAGHWRFEPIGEAGSRVSLDLEFDITNPLLRVTVAPVFKHIADSLVAAFCARAEAVYGKKSFDTG